MNVNDIRPTQLPPVGTPAVHRTARQAPAAQAEQKESIAPRDVLNGPEKEFFASAFPSAADELRAPAVYRKDGVQPQVSLGGMIDRKG
jgi:hypothetical protein